MISLDPLWQMGPPQSKLSISFECCLSSKDSNLYDDVCSHECHLLLSFNQIDVGMSGKRNSQSQETKQIFAPGNPAQYFPGNFIKVLMKI